MVIAASRHRRRKGIRKPSALSVIGYCHEQYSEELAVNRESYVIPPSFNNLAVNAIVRFMENLDTRRIVT